MATTLGSIFRRFRIHAMGLTTVDIKQSVPAGRTNYIAYMCVHAHFNENGKIMVCSSLMKPWEYKKKRCVLPHQILQLFKSALGLFTSFVLPISNIWYPSITQMAILENSHHCQTMMDLNWSYGLLWSALKKHMHLGLISCFYYDRSKSWSCCTDQIFLHHDFITGPSTALIFVWCI